MMENINDFASFVVMVSIVVILLYIGIHSLAQEQHIRRYEKEVEYYSEFYEEEEE